MPSVKTMNVEDMSPQERFLYWIRERHSIYLKRKAGLPKPWTNDPILQMYKFCNPVRMNDRVSQWLLNSWYKPNFNHPNMLLACSLARQLNNPGSLEAVGFPVDWVPEAVQSVLEDRSSMGLKNYSPAYMITANYGKRGREKQTKAYQTVWIVCQPIYESGLLPDTSSMKNTWEKLLSFTGFSSFIAGQVVADLRWAMKGTWKDKESWAPMGPGSKRGMNRYYGRPIDFDIDQLQFLSELRSLYTTSRGLPGIPPMEIMDFQSCFCEFDKYERVLWGEGRPKQRYDGGI